MPDVLDRFGWAAVAAIPIVAVAICIVAVTFAALAARQPATRRHYLRVMAHLAQMLSALRGGQ